MAAILSTHPRHEQRIAELTAYIRTIPAGEVRIEGDGRQADRWVRQTEPVRRLAPAYARQDRARQALLQAIRAAQQQQDGLVRQKLAEAEREIAQAIQLTDQAQFATLQGYILVGQGRRPEARTAFARALGLYPGYQPAQRALTRLAG
jgi:predicted Zn-dependent protease